MNLLCDIHGFTEYDPISLKCLLCLSEGEDGSKVSGNQSQGEETSLEME